MAEREASFQWAEVEKPVSYWTLAGQRLAKNPVALAAAAVLLLVCTLAILATWITPYGADEGIMSDRLNPIGSSGHILGNDEQGRDMLTRLIYGSRMSLLAGVMPVAIALVVGGILGITAGFVGGWSNVIIMRVMDIFYALPLVLLAIAIAGTLGPGLNNAIIAISVVLTPPITRVAEGVTAHVQGQAYVEAAKASGASTVRIVLEQVLPNISSTILVYASTLVGLSIVAAAGLSFLGLGVSSPDAEWGLMLRQLRLSLVVAPWVAALPGAAIFITAMSFNILSDGVRDALDVRV